MNRLCVALALTDLPVVVVGGGGVAERKVAALLAAGARVTVIAPTLGEALRGEVAAGRVEWRPRPWQTGDLAGARFVCAATDDQAVNRAVAAEAAAAGLFCNVASPAEAGSCHFLATVRRGPVTLAVTSDGASPYAVARLRETVEAALAPEVGELIELLGELREEVGERYATQSERRAAWERLWSSEALALLRQGDRAGARASLRKCLG